MKPGRVRIGNVIYIYPAAPKRVYLDWFGLLTYVIFCAILIAGIGGWMEACRHRPSVIRQVIGE